MTLENIRALDKATLTCTEIAQVLNADPAALRWQARFDPKSLGFPVIVIKTRVKIPRLPFIRFMETGKV